MPLALLPRGDPGRVLRSASCPTHATLTSVFETAVLRRLLHAVRVGLDLRSRRSRLTQLPLSVAREHDIERLILPVSSAPIVAILPIFAAAPAHVDGRPYNGGIDVRGAHVFQVSGPPLAALAPLLNRQLGIKRLEFTATIERDTYERFLLKIAYAWLCSNLAWMESLRRMSSHRFWADRTTWGVGSAVMVKTISARMRCTRSVAAYSARRSFAESGSSPVSARRSMSSRSVAPLRLASTK